MLNDKLTFCAIQELSSYDKIYKSLLNLEHVVSVHGLKVWTLTVNRTELICHLGVLKSSNDENAEKIYEAVLQSATDMLRAKYGIEVTTLQVEKISQDSIKNCISCQPIKH